MAVMLMWHYWYDRSCSVLLSDTVVDPLPNHYMGNILAVL